MKLENQVPLKFVKEQLKIAFRQRKLNLRPILMVGESGIGKTAIIQQATGELSAELSEQIDFTNLDLLAMDPGELMGWPKEKDGRLTYARPHWFPVDGDGTKGILRLGEINRAHREVKNVILDLIGTNPMDRRIGGHKLSEDWIVVADCNPSESQTGGTYDVDESDVAFHGRFRQFGIAPDVEGFKDWFLKEYGADEVYQFIVADPSLVAFDGRRGTPRDLASLSRSVSALKATYGGFEHVDSVQLHSVAAADVGIDLAASFVHFADLRHFCTPENILGGKWAECEAGLLKAKEQKRFDIEMAIMRGVTDRMIRAELDDFKKFKLDNVIKFYEFIGGDKSLASIQFILNEFERTGDVNQDRKIDKLIDQGVKTKSKFLGWAKEVTEAKRSKAK